MNNMEKNFGPMSYYKSTEVVLSPLQEALEFVLNPREFESLSISVRDEYGKYAVEIKRRMFGERIQKSITVDFAFKKPKTWWQHFKQENFPSWLLRRYPVEYSFQTEKKTVEFDRAFIFPEAYREGHPVLGNFIIHDYHEDQQ